MGIMDQELTPAQIRTAVTLACVIDATVSVGRGVVGENTASRLNGNRVDREILSAIVATDATNALFNGGAA